MRYTLDPMKQEQVCSFIRAGGVGWVAAEAVGIPRTVFRLWLERGAKSPREPYAGLYLAVMQAEAQSRLKAEIEVRQNQPLQWLKYGPGKALPGQPGWTGESAAETEASAPTAVLSPFQINHLMGVFADVFAQYPAAKAALQEALAAASAPAPATDEILDPVPCCEG